MSDTWFFTYWFYCSNKIFSCPFLFPCFIYIVAVIFTMLTCGNIKDHPYVLVSQRPTIKLTQHTHNLTMNRFLNILEEKQPEEIIDETDSDTQLHKCPYGIFCQSLRQTIRHFLRIKKSGMFSEYFKKLVLKYFNGKNIFHFFCLKLYGNCLKLTEMFLAPGF